MKVLVLLEFELTAIGIDGDKLNFGRKVKPRNIKMSKDTVGKNVIAGRSLHPFK